MSRIEVIHCFGKMNAGGAETLIYNVYKAIDKNRFHFSFLVFNSDSGFYDEDIKQLGGDIFYLPCMSDKGVWRYLNNLIAFFKEHKPDVVHSHMDWQGGFIAYAANKANVKKIIVHAHADQRIFKKNLFYKCLINLNKILIKKYATHRLACSRSAGESLFCQDFKILNNGIDYYKFQHADLSKISELKEEFNIKPADIVIGSVGGLSKNKNHVFLIDVFHDLYKFNSNYKLIIVGDGVERGTLEKKVNDLKLFNAVYFAGVRKDIPEFMNVFDVFALPSLSEGLGIVAIEAQACGLPCVLSECVPSEVDFKQSPVCFLPLIKSLWVKALLNHDFIVSKKKTDPDDLPLRFSISNTETELEDLYKFY